MVRYFYTICFLVCLSWRAFAQSNDQNYTLTRTYKVRAATEATGNSYNGTPHEVTTQVSYFDGLGQSTQQVTAFAGNIGQDLMTRTVYDAYGRATQNYAPIPAPGNSGGWVSNPIGIYYNSSAEVCGPTANYYKESLFEASPLNRPTEQRDLGVTTGVRTYYQTNTANSVIRYRISGPNLRDLSSSGFYVANTLTLTETKDENNVTSQIFEDSDKRKILKRIVLPTENLDTYYVYDEADQLRIVLQPQYQLEANLEYFAFMYLYNNRGLAIRKKIPGKGEESMTYDSRDRLATMTDAKSNTFSYQYDELNRLTQVSVNNNPIQYIYYDNYNFGPFTNGGFSNELNLNATDHFVSNPQTESRKGLETGQSVRMLNADGTYGNWYQTVRFYDNRNRLIQQNRQLHGLSGSAYERVSYQYDFGAKPVLERATQYTGSITYRIDKAFTYDQADRLSKTQHTVYENGTVIKSYEHNRLTYNQVGLPASKEWYTGAFGLLYKYTPRGWVCQQQSSKGPGFNQTLQYNANGNIQSSSVSTNGGQFSGSSTYSYDLANRLTATNGSGSLAGFDESNITYDRNGNLKTLNRTWSGQLIDQLTYNYGGKGNQVHRIGDSGNNSLAEKGFVNNSEYDNELTYDFNGNLYKDDNRSISSITYSVLNLAQKVTISGSTVQYDYDASGTKRRMTGPNGVSTAYEGNFEYNANGTLLRISLEEGQLVRSSSGVYTVQYYYKDHLGNVRQVASENGTVVQQTEYYGFGMAVLRQGDVNTNKYLYNGKEQQLLTPWLDYGARMYDPTIGRWNVVDPMASEEPTMTPYRYAFNNPIRVTDPDGQFEYSDGYSTQDSRFASGSIQFDGSYQNSGDDPGKGNSPNQGSKPAKQGEGKPTSQDIEKANGSAGNNVVNNDYGPEWVSYVPVVGSGRDAYRDFKNEDYGWAAFNTAMAISDMFLVKSLIIAGGKIVTNTAFKTGSHTWRATRSWLGKTGQAAPKQEIHHWALSQKIIKQYGLEAIGNQPWNLMPTRSAVFHQAIHGKGPEAYGIGGRLWHGTPTWFKSVVSYGLGSVENATR